MKDAILISPPFFHYEDFIKEELEKKGYRVFYLNHRKGKVADALLSFTSIEKQRTLYVNTLMKRLMKLPKGNIELLLVIKGEFLDQSHVEYLKKENPNIKCVMYQWDSVVNADYLPLVPFFDKVYTFDFQDAEKYKFNYLPLFYTNDILMAEKKPEDIDLLLIGTFNPLRYNYFLRLKGIARKYDLRFYAYIYTPFSFYFRKQILKNELHIHRLTDIRFFPLSRKRLIDYYSRAKVVVDVCRADQTGLSMRMVESYGMNKKVLTANTYLKKDPMVGEISFLNTDASDEKILNFIHSHVYEYSHKRELNIARWVDMLLQM